MIALLHDFSHLVIMFIYEYTNNLHNQSIGENCYFTLPVEKEEAFDFLQSGDKLESLTLKLCNYFSFVIIIFVVVLVSRICTDTNFL